MAASVANAVTASSTTSVTVIDSPTFTATAGNTLFIAVAHTLNRSSTLTTSGSDTVTDLDVGNATPGSAGSHDAYAQNIAGGAGYKATSTTGFGSPGSIHVAELAGVLTTGVLDVSVAASITPASTTPSTGASATTAQADEIAVCFIHTDSTANPSTQTAGSGWTAATSNTNGNAASSAVEYKILASTQTVTGTYTTDNVTSRITAYSFKASAGGGGPSVTYPRLERGIRGVKRGIY